MPTPPPEVLKEYRKAARRGENLKKSLSTSAGWILLSDQALYLGQPLDRFLRGEITGVEFDRAGNGPGTMFFMAGSEPLARVDFAAADRPALTTIEKALAPRRKKVQLLLNRSPYAPGEVVKGDVVIDWPKSGPVRGVRVGLVGAEETSITVSTGSGKHQTSRTYREEETQIAEEWILFGGDQVSWSESVGEALRSAFGNQKYPVLPAGRHRFPFEFRLPENALPCFDGHYARVSYRLYAVVDVPLGFDRLFDGTLIVAEPRKAEVSARTHEDHQRVKGFLKTLPGGLRLGFQIGRSPYHYGEKLKVRLRVENDSGKRIRSARVALYSVEAARAKHLERESSTELESVTIKFPDPSAVNHDYRFEIPVPAWPVPFVGRYSRVDLWLGAALDVAMAHDATLTVPLDVV